MALPGPNEVVSSLFGAVRLLRRDPGGLNNFNLTEDGFWRSFSAILFVVPVFALADFALRQDQQLSAMAVMSRKSVTLALQWMAFVAAMLVLTRALKISHNYMRFVTVYNWASVIAVGLVLVPVLLYGLGLLGLHAATFVGFFVLLGLVVYAWYVAREALECSGFVAAGVVLLEYLMAITVERLFGLPQPL
ncbi:MAG: hypothetical protein AAGF81_19125 [Pseudomonadota bacterium]